jgi:hypothetical protein
MLTVVRTTSEVKDHADSSQDHVEGKRPCSNRTQDRTEGKRQLMGLLFHCLLIYKHSYGLRIICLEHLHQN